MAAFSSLAAPSAGDGKVAAPSTVDDKVVDQQIAALENFVRTRSPGGVRPPSSRFHSGRHASLALCILKALDDARFAAGLDALQTDRADTGRLYAPFRLFRAEWRAYLGPDPHTALPPAAPHVRDAEAMMFPMLFPYGMGHYDPAVQKDMTFEEYAAYRLSLSDPAFRASRAWLRWALSRTADERTAAVLNCVLAVKHGVKARHLGGGRVETIPLQEDFDEPTRSMT